jgi:VIT1/CCC1 family predicted Fe2+/Mn2+ transporter
MANLLGYQDELTDLEEALRGLDYQRDSEQQRESRRSLMRRLRESLKHYYEALLLQEQIFTALEPPRPSDARLLGEMAPPYPASCELASPTQTVDEHTDDLVALGGLSDRDSLEKMVGRMMPALFPGRNPSAQDLRSRNTSSRDIASLFSPFTRRVTRMVIALGTALLMLAPMVLLRFLKSALWTMVSIAAFTLVLAVMVAVGTRGRGESIVMVIAAYAAVLVVFVQNNGSDCGGKC